MESSPTRGRSVRNDDVLESACAGVCYTLINRLSVGKMEFGGLWIMIIVAIMTMTMSVGSVSGQAFEAGTYNEFKVEIAGSYEECFYQHVPDKATFYMSMEVLRGQDQMVDVFVRSEDMEVIHSEISIKDSFYKLDDAREGTYSVCVDNVYSRFGSKLVFVYITAFEPAKFEAYVKEMEAVQSLAANVSESLNNVQTSVRDMLTFQARHRFQMVRDMYLARGNNHYVSVWSLSQCVVIVICAIVQVYMVRRLFRTTNVTPTTSKPRA